ncbi:hypothetical protein [Spongiactinospora sp. 9N601]|uniref:hypothetical protein n=1 Tax=Spongiactinospora sp. 9N601 TaxID=3375149 RepID=UPI0037A90538
MLSRLARLPKLAVPAALLTATLALTTAAMPAAHAQSTDYTCASITPLSNSAVIGAGCTAAPGAVTDGLIHGDFTIAETGGTAYTCRPEQPGWPSGQAALSSPDAAVLGYHCTPTNTDPV